MSLPSFTRRTLLQRGGLVLTSVSIAGCLDSTTGGASSTTTVEMTDELVFKPAKITISAGDTVRWRNVGNVEHTVTAYEDKLPKEGEYFASGGFKSEGAARKNLNGGLIPSNEQFMHTFDISGVYEYYCIPHESAGMVGTVQVE